MTGFAQRHDQEGVAFPQVGSQSSGGKGRSGRDLSKDMCYNCGDKGHHAKDCPKLTEEEKHQLGVDHVNIHTEAEDNGDDVQECVDGIANLNVQGCYSGDGDESDSTCDSCIDGVGFLEVADKKQKRATCSRDKVYLDSCATNHSMFALEHLERRHTTRVCLRQSCNAGSRLTQRKGFWFLFQFWENPDGIANLLSLVELENNGWIIKYETGNIWAATSPDGQVTINFLIEEAGVCKGMPYVDLTRPDDHIVYNINGMVMIETVRKNYEGFTREQVTRAAEARDAMAMMAHPMEEKFKKHVVSSAHVVRNFNLSLQDIANANALFVPNRGSLKGKTIRRKPGKVRPEYVSIPRAFYERIKNVTLAADVMFVNGLPFFVTLSRDIKLVSVEFLPSRTADQLCSSLRKVIRIYRRGGYMIRTSLMDMEFEPLVDILDEIVVNTTAAREHVGDIERSIRSIKDRGRCIVSELPYNDCMPDQVVIHLIYFVVFWMNAMPSDSGISEVYSPREIVTGMKLDFKKHCRARFGAYVEASYDDVITNTMKDRTHACIALGPTGNVQGSLKCFDLETGRIVKRRTVTPVPMPNRILKKIKKWGQKSKQMRSQRRLDFLNRNKEKFGWDIDADDELEGLLETPEPRDTDDIPAELPGIQLTSDYDDLRVVQQQSVTENDIVAAAMANANLGPSLELGEITGVNTEDNDHDHLNAGPRDAHIISDGEESDDDEEGEYAFGNDNHDEDLGDNPYGVLADNEEETENEHTSVLDDVNNGPEGGLAQEVDHDESPDVIVHHHDDDDKDDGTTVGMRRSKRKRRKKHAQVIDFKNKKVQGADGVIHMQTHKNDFSYRAKVCIPTPKCMKTQPRVDEFDGNAYRLVEGMLHINPSMLQQAKNEFMRRESKELQECANGDGNDYLTEDHVVTHVLGIILATQYSVKKGIKLFGERGKESVTSELQQLHDMVTFLPVHAYDLTRKQRKEALASLMFMTEKRCGRVKSRACANGSKQRQWIRKEDAASPTVMSDSVMITTAIEAHEGRKVITLDIPGAFLNTEIDEEVIMMLRGELAELMVNIDPALYGPYVITTKRGENFCM